MSSGSKVIPREILERFIIHGEMPGNDPWETYLVVDRLDGQDCVMRFDRKMPETAAERRLLLRSCLRVRRVKHPSLARIRRFGLPPRGGFYIVHEYRRAPTLRSLRSSLDWSTVVNALAGILPGLHLLHLNGIVHQRLSADRILVEGLGGRANAILHDTGPNPGADGRRWAPLYLQAPEVARGEKFDGRADLFSLAVAVHEAVVGRPPFSNEDAERTARLGGYLDVPPMRIHREDCPPILEEILMRMGSHDPRDRPRSALQLARELRRTGLLEGAPPNLSPGDILQAARWRLVEDKVEQALDAIPEDLQCTRVTGEPDLETVADEVQARLELRSRATAIRYARDEESPTQEGVECVIVWNTTSPRPAEANRLHVPVSRGITKGCIRNWVRTFTAGPLERRREAVLVPWLHWAGRGREQGTAELVLMQRSTRPRAVGIDWERMQARIVESLTGRRDDHGRGDFPDMDPVVNAAKLSRAVMPVAAAWLLESTIEATSRPSCRLAHRHYRISTLYDNAGRVKKAAQHLELAAKALPAGQEAVSRVLDARRAALLFQAGFPGDVEPGWDEGECNGTALSFWRSVAGIEEVYAEGRLEEADRLIARQTSDRTGITSRTTAGSHGDVCRYIKTLQLRARSLYQRGSYNQVLEVATAERSARARFGLGVGTENEEYANACALLSLAQPRNAKRRGLRSLRASLGRGKQHLAAMAMESLAAIEHADGRFATASSWGEASRECCIGTDRGGTVVRQLAAEAALQYSSGEYRLSVFKGIESLRTGGTLRVRSRHKGQSLSIGLSLCAIGRYGQAVKWLERFLEDSRNRTDKPWRLIAYSQLAQIFGESGASRRLISIVRMAMMDGLSKDTNNTSFVVNALAAWPETAETLLADLGEANLPGFELLRESCLDATTTCGLRRLRAGIDIKELSRCELSRLGTQVTCSLNGPVQFSEVPRWSDIEQLCRRLVSEGEVALAVRLSALAARTCRRWGLFDWFSRFCGTWTRTRSMLRQWGSAKHEAGLGAFCCDREMRESKSHFVELQCAIEEVEELDRLLCSESKSTELGSSLVGNLTDRTIELIDEIVCVGGASGKVRAISGGVDSGEFADVSDRVGRCLPIGIEEFEHLRLLLGSSRRIVWRRPEQEAGILVATRDADLILYAVCGGAIDDVSEYNLHRMQMVEMLGETIRARAFGEGNLPGDIGAEPVSVDHTTFGLDVEVLEVRPHRLLYCSAEMEAVIQAVRRLARRKHPVLLLGESGTGKEGLARWYHQCSSSGPGEFVPVDCPALCSGVAESELFGHVSGSFTGADRARLGVLETAKGGTVFLDEIGDLPAGLQAKLLRVLSTGEVRPVGAQKAIRVSFGLVSATNVDLKEAAAENRFREDLFFRLGVPVQVPALRDRRSDIIPLWDWFVRKYALPTDEPRYADSVTDILMGHDWPGNVRELENVARASIALAEGGAITADSVLVMLGEARSIHAPGIPTDEAWSAGSRLWKALDLVRRKGRVTRSSYAEAAGISARSALRDLTELVRQGVLERRGSGRATRYVPVGA